MSESDQEVVAWSFPTRILYGIGSATRVAGEMQKLRAKRAFVVTDTGVVTAGLIEPIVEALSAAGLESTVFEGVSSNPLETEVLAAKDAYQQAGCDLVLAVGGGSPLDVGKLVRLATTHPLPLAQYDDAIGGGERVVNPLPPMIAVPTTAGTGSEVGRSGVVTIQATNKKTVIFAPSLMPTVAILDPQLTVTLPPRATAATGMDALTHCVEAYCALGDHPMADAIALKGISFVARNLETAVHDGKDLQARGAMLKAAMMGAVAFQKGLGACHALAHPLGAEYGLHHGLANALCLPAVLDFNRSTIPGKIARVAKLLGARGQDEETLAFECAGAVRMLRKKVGLADGLGAEGVPEEGLEKLAKLAYEDASHRSNPRPCTVDDLLCLYKASY